jgi:hypothetical protein
MKRIALLLAGSFLLIANVSFSQGIDDRAVIPVAVTLNSILRLNVTSGGNIEFNFNTLNDYQYGIQTSANYQTKFNIASSVAWNVNMFAEDATLIGTDIISVAGEVGPPEVTAVNSNIMTLDNIGYAITLNGSSTNYKIGPSGGSISTVFPLTSAPSNLLIGYDGTNSNAGDINQNAFTINWRCGTQETNMRQTSILTQNLAADRYATNVFLILEPAL